MMTNPARAGFVFLYKACSERVSMTQPDRFFWLCASACATLACLALSPGLAGAFIFDDFPNIVTNSALHIRTLNVQSLLYAAYSFEPGGSSRALSMLSFALDFWRAGLDPHAFKVTNLVIHALTCLVLALFLKRVLRVAGWREQHATVAALLMTAFWALHPLQVSSVLYVVQRMQTLGTLFLLLALLFYMRMRQAQMCAARSRGEALMVLLFAALGFSAKEDAVLLPAYVLALELTVLKFAAADEVFSRRLRWAFALAVGLALLIFVFMALPRYWHWDLYPRRDFSSPDRLLTQGRVLVMYLSQILLPWPDTLRFFYDDIEISRSLWKPWTTLPALMLLAGLLALAWRLRSVRPVFSLGVLLFFAGHFLTSNIIALELAFEHRNHFPLIGVVLAVGDLLSVLFRKLKFARALQLCLLAALLAAFGSATAARAHVWGDTLRFAEHTLELAPRSERAWVFLCSTYFLRSGQQPDSPGLNVAIDTCEQGTRVLPESASLQSNLLIFKSIRGDATQEDWDELIKRLDKVRMTVQNKRILWVTLDNVDRGVLNNESATLRIIESIASRSTLHPAEYRRVAAYIFNETHEPVKAFPFMQRAVELSAPDDAENQKMFRELRSIGREDWVEQLEQIHRPAVNQGKPND